MSKARLLLWIALALFAAAVSPVPSAGASSGGAVPSGSELQEAHDFGDIAEQSDAVFVRTRLEDAGGSAASAGDWRDYCFELSASRKVGLGLRQLDRNADLVLLGDSGEELASDRTAGTASEWLEVSLRAGDYCARVVAVEAGENHFVFRYGTGPADPDSLLPAETLPDTADDSQTAGLAAEFSGFPDSRDGSSKFRLAQPEATPEPAATPQPEATPEPTATPQVVWSATVQADVVGILDGHEYVGYSVYSQSGALRTNGSDDDRHRYTVFALASSETAQALVLMATLPQAAGLELQVGEHRFAIADAAPPSPAGGQPSEAGDIYFWDAPGLHWSAGDEIEARFLFEPADRYPNVVLILADDLGWGDVRANNPDSRIATPNIDSIAGAGVRFTDAHSPSSVCTGTRYGLLTGRYSWRTRLTQGVLNGYSGPLIEHDRPTLGTLLQGHGYRTAAIGKWHLGLRMFVRISATDPQSLTRTVIDGPLQHGFDEFFGLSANVNWRPKQYIETDRFTSTPDARSILDRLTAESVGFIERAARHDQPFFLYFPLTAPHQPLVPADRFHGQTGLGRYGDFIAQVDWTVGEILGAIDRAGARDNTLVIFTSDNGSFMGTAPNHAADHTESPDHRRYRPENHQANGPWRNGKGSVYEGGHRVPLIMRWPSFLTARSTVDAAVSLTDLWATLAEVVGEQSGPGVAPDSVSLWPLLRGETAGRGRPVVLHSNQGTFAIRDGPWKLVFGVGSGKRGDSNSGPPFSTPWQLYNLSADPGETLNLVDRHPEVVTRLSAALDAIRSGTAPEFTTLVAAGNDERSHLQIRP